MIDFAKMRGEEAFLKRALSKFGINLSVNDAIAQLASTIRDHAHFQRLITEAEPKMRQDFYDSVRPHLKFAAKPLDVYISDAKQMAEREQLPVLTQDGKLLPFKPARDANTAEKDVEEAIARSIAERTLMLTCSKCTGMGLFYGLPGETPVAVIMKARREGWVFDPVDRSETCPKCVVVN